MVVEQALKLSEDYNLNEIYCVGLLVSAHQEVGLIAKLFFFFYHMHPTCYISL